MLIDPWHGILPRPQTLQRLSPPNSSRAQSLFPAHLPFLSFLVPAVGWSHLVCFQGLSEMLCYCSFKCLVLGEALPLSFMPSTLTGETAGRAPGCLPRGSPLSADHRNTSRPSLPKLGTFLGSLRNEHKKLRASPPSSTVSMLAMSTAVHGGRRADLQHRVLRSQALLSLRERSPHLLRPFSSPDDGCLQ